MFIRLCATKGIFSDKLKLKTNIVQLYLIY